MHTLSINAQLYCNVLGSALIPAEDTTLVPVHDTESDPCCGWLGLGLKLHVHSDLPQN